MGVKIFLATIFIFVNLQGMPTDKKISTLDFAATLADANEIVLNQAGTSVSAPLRDDTLTRADVWRFFNPCDIRCATLAITPAQVVLLNTTPLTIVAAPGAGIAIDVVSGTMELQFVAVAYAVNTSLSLLTNTAIENQGSVEINGSLSKILKFGTNTPIGAADTQIIANQPLTVFVEVGNTTLGDSGIVVRVMYRLISV